MRLRAPELVAHTRKSRDLAPVRRDGARTVSFWAGTGGNRSRSAAAWRQCGAHVSCGDIETAGRAQAARAPPPGRAWLLGHTFAMSALTRLLAFTARARAFTRPEWARERRVPRGGTPLWPHQPPQQRRVKRATAAAIARAFFSRTLLVCKMDTPFSSPPQGGAIIPPTGYPKGKLIVIQPTLCARVKTA